MGRVTAYFREVKAEMRKVIWPTSRETIVFTVVVVVSVLLISLLIWGMDLVFGAFLNLIIT